MPNDEQFVLAQVARINKMLMATVDAASVEVFDTLLTQAALVASEQRSLVPVDSASPTPGALKASIRVEEGKNRRGLPAVFIKAGGKTTRRRVEHGKAGFAYEYDYARAEEFGTQKEAARSFFYPIWRARRKEVRAAVKKAVRNAVVKAFK